MQRAIPAVVMRGGTSRGVFFHERDLPEPGARRDRILLEVLGSPGPTQADGLGGGMSMTSKVMIVASATDQRSDVEYEFAQVHITELAVDHVGNCGNLTAAVAAFAVDEGLVPAVAPATTVLLRNRNTDTVVRAVVPVSGGRSRVQGTAAVAGIHGTGAPITTEYLSPNGAVFNAPLPTGAPSDVIAVPEIGELEVSIVDVTNPLVFVAAAGLGMSGQETPADALYAPGLLDRSETLRRVVVRLLAARGLLEDLTTFSAHQPKVAVVAPPRQGMEGVDLTARVLAGGRMHPAFPATGLLCLGAATNIPGTIPARTVAGPPPDGRVTIEHAAGTATVSAALTVTDGVPHVERVGIERTARRIMQGEVLIRA